MADDTSLGEASGKVRLDAENAVAVLTIDNPPANSIGVDVLAAMSARLDDVEKDKSLRAIVVIGQGDNFFSAGADVKMLTSEGGEKQLRILNSAVDLFDRLEAFGKPIVAAVNGFCLGGGNELALSCDLRIASEKSRFGQPEINLGLTPGWGGTQRLLRAVAPAHARELLLTGRMASAQEALSMGLVNEVVAHDQVLVRAKEVASELAAKAPLAIAEIKRRLADGAGDTLVASVREDMRGFAKLLTSKDGKEGLAAFLEKRAPNFVGE